MDPQIVERIRLFKMVRDIPFYLGLDGEQGYECVTKPEILDRLFRTIGLKSRHIICEFRWKNLDLPDELMKLPHDDPETHEYLEVWIPEGGKWIIVDPNWDSRIKWPTIPIAEWDGSTDTKLAVIPIKTLSPQESSVFITKDVGEEREKYMERNRKFFIALNRWLESIRKKT